MDLILYQDAEAYSGGEITNDEDPLAELKRFINDEEIAPAEHNTQMDIKIENLTPTAEESLSSDNELPDGAMKCEFVSILKETIGFWI